MVIFIKSHLPFQALVPVQVQHIDGQSVLIFGQQQQQQQQQQQG